MLEHGQQRFLLSWDSVANSFTRVPAMAFRSSEEICVILADLKRIGAPGDLWLIIYIKVSAVESLCKLPCLLEVLMLAVP